ncbi:hypothetical protein JMJ77_0003772 [Colletotrichum scovillei]|uniref:Uncharacterized protein n=1 Tax=Colletotrichum scovillei TaxID=1209932 RepID=A0A9P7QX81_9PEZI|nr:hypothetical protein JMJ77_0003772 [Colletotrichum scovillei]KAG7049019.1 hypothetical protein JMJ78_0013003 [Colletotrichum scovillei]KAG7063762.1 hypothetical protein JMJ76_0006811 [Colletotrichum scovillei]
MTGCFHLSATPRPWSCLKSSFSSSLILLPNRDELSGSEDHHQTPQSGRQKDFCIPPTASSVSRVQGQ